LVVSGVMAAWSASVIGLPSLAFLHLVRLRTKERGASQRPSITDITDITDVVERNPHESTLVA
jgi:hypothetical protein